MALSPRDEPGSAGGFSELDEELASARDSLLRFADAERVLENLVCDPGDPECRYPDLRSARQYATVDELLRVVARIPDADPDERQEGGALYPALLELAELFDILIDQHSLVYGDAVALAESMEPGWHAMAGCFNHDPTPEAATETVKRAAANLAALPGLLDEAGRLSADARRDVAARFDAARGSAWKAEARYLASHGASTWLPHGVNDARLQRALKPARERPGREPQIAGDASESFTHATADLLLARLVHDIAGDRVVQALEAPFTGLLTRG